MKNGSSGTSTVAWTLGQALHYPRTVRTLAAYEALKKVYEGPLPRAKKLAEKAKIIDELVDDLKLRTRPNNASLTESRVYNGGAAPLLLAHRACGDLASLLRAGKTLARRDFAKTLQDDLTPISKILAERCRAARH